MDGGSIPPISTTGRRHTLVSPGGPRPAGRGPSSCLDGARTRRVAAAAVRPMPCRLRPRTPVALQNVVDGCGYRIHDPATNSRRRLSDAPRRIDPRLKSVSCPAYRQAWGAFARSPGCASSRCTTSRRPRQRGGLFRTGLQLAVWNRAPLPPSPDQVALRRGGGADRPTVRPAPAPAPAADPRGLVIVVGAQAEIRALAH